MAAFGTGVLMGVTDQKTKTKAKRKGYEFTERLPAGVTPERARE